MSNDINVAMAFMRYCTDPSVDTAEAVAIAVEGRPDLGISAQRTREVLVENIELMRAAATTTPAAQTATLMQKLLAKGQR